MSMDLKCECGGTLSSTTLRSFDFSAYAGLPVLVAETPGLRCQKCDSETLDGETISVLLQQLAMLLMSESRRLTAAEAKFLRKRMRLTQAQLAERMGVVRETVADWERGASVISSQHDFMIRAIFASSIMHDSDNHSVSKGVVDAVAKTMHAVRQTSPMPLPEPHVIQQALGRMRGASRLRQA